MAVEIQGPLDKRFDEVLTAEALAFVEELHRGFDQRRRELLAARRDLQHQLDAGWMPDFREDTAQIREADWQVAPAPPDLLDRRVDAIEYRECSITFIEQCNMVDEFMGKGRVVSFHAPYSCESCGKIIACRHEADEFDKGAVFPELSCH